MEGDSVTLKEIEKWYGGETAHALAQYCDETGKAVDEVAASDREWNRFESWSKSKKRGLGRDAKKFGNWVKASRIDQKGAARRLGKIYDRPVDSDIYGESFDEPADEYEMADFIARCLDREGTIHVDEHGDEADFFFEFNDIPYRVTVEQVEDFSSRDNHSEPLPWKPKRK